MSANGRGGSASSAILASSDIPRIRRDPASDRRSRRSRTGIGRGSQSSSPTPHSRPRPRTPSTINRFYLLFPRGSCAPRKLADPKHAEPAPSAGAPKGTLRSSHTNGARPFGSSRRTPGTRNRLTSPSRPSREWSLLEWRSTTRGESVYKLGIETTLGRRGVYKLKCSRFWQKLAFVSN